MLQLMASTVPRRLLPMQAESSYSSVVLGMTPLAYWRMNALGSLVDAVGTRHGTFAGTGAALAAGLPQNGDSSVDFGGTASASVPNDAGLALAAFSLAFWFKVNGNPGAGERWALVCRDESGDVTGDFATLLEDDGTLTIGSQVAGVAREVVPAPTFDIGVTHHLVVRANNTGFDAYMDGTYLGKNTAFTAAWTGNVHPIRFASVTWRPELADVVLDEVALWNRVVTEAEVLSLSQRTAQLPVADADIANVPESATTALDILANDHYVGAKTGVTITITQQPGAGDSVTVRADRDVDYVAGAVGANTVRTFQYRITDPVGMSNTATCTVTVLDAATPPPAGAVANCYVENATNPIIVNTSPLGPALATAINTAAATGRNILIAAGTYAGGTATFNPQGTAANPVVIRPQGAIGSVTVNNPLWTIANGSSRLVISKLFFNVGSGPADENAGCIMVNGTNHRITRCWFQQVNTYCVAIVNGDFIRVDHCDMSDWTAPVRRKGFVTFYLPDFRLGNHGDVLVDYNYLHDYSLGTPNPNASNAFNTSSGAAWNRDFRVEFSHNLMRNATPLSDTEFITAKFSGIVVAFNTFDNVDGYLQQRQGGGWKVRSNWLENTGSTSPLKGFDDFTGGTQSGAGRALVIGNRLVGGLDMWVASGNSATAGPNFYHASREGRYIGNIVGGQIRVGTNYDGAGAVAAQNNNLWNNRVGAGAVLQNGFGANLVNVNSTGTTFNADNEAFTPAVKIAVPTGNPATDQVGPRAPDPLCPGGPQS